MNLSKSLYTRGLQCSKSLWLKKYKPEVLSVADTQAQAIFETGDKVGALACELFPDGKVVPFKGTSFEEKIALTQTWMDEGTRNIYEATFQYDGILVMVDILHIDDDGSVEIHEVKSSTEVKDAHMDDASIQYYVLEGLGYDVKKTSIIHINNKYVRANNLELDKLFTIADISSEVLQMQEDIPTYLKHFQKQLESKDVEPNIDIGKHCSKPYECDAMAYCWKHIPEYSIFNISRLRSDKKFEMYRDDVIDFSQIGDTSSFSLAQQIQIASELNQTDIINKEAIAEFVDGLSYPLYHLDFETFQQAIPEWEDISPFMQIPFQYSIHAEFTDAPMKHYEFLALEGEDPRYELAKNLVNDIPTNVTVLAYNMGFEKGVIRKLAAMFEEFSSQLIAIHDNIQDLMTPFQKKDYYVPSMKGSYSIKKVLPALVPTMAEAYKELEGVQNGGDAMQTYAKLAHMDDKAEVARLREALLRYCELDTMAMVRVSEKLKECV